jgi:low affinity Fe/Cu permease
MHVRPFSRIKILGTARLFPSIPQLYHSLNRWLWFGATSLAVAYFTKSTIHQYHRVRELNLDLLVLNDLLDVHEEKMDRLEADLNKRKTDLITMEDLYPVRGEEVWQQLEEEHETIRKELQEAWVHKRELLRNIARIERKIRASWVM